MNHGSASVVLNSLATVTFVQLIFEIKTLCLDEVDCQKGEQILLLGFNPEVD